MRWRSLVEDPQRSVISYTNSLRSKGDMHCAQKVTFISYEKL